MMSMHNSKERRVHVYPPQTRVRQKMQPFLIVLIKGQEDVYPPDEWEIVKTNQTMIAHVLSSNCLYINYNILYSKNHKKIKLLSFFCDLSFILYYLSYKYLGLF